MSGYRLARCPLCGAAAQVMPWCGRRIYMTHGATRGVPMSVVDGDFCEASGWLVEDDEMLPRERKRRSDAGRARPPRTPRP